VLIAGDECQIFVSGGCVHYCVYCVEFVFLFDVCSLEVYLRVYGDDEASV